MNPSQQSIDVSQGAPSTHRLQAGRFRVTLAEFEGDQRLASHFHERACVSLILQGRFVQRFPGATYECPPGGLLAKPPAERHEDRWCGVRTRHVIVEPDPAAHDELGPLARTVEEVGFRLDPWALGIGRRMAAEFRTADDVTALALEGLILELLVRLRRTGSAASGTSPPPWLERMRRCLHDRHGESLRLSELAAEAGVHASELSRQFRHHYGTSPAAYLRRVRLRGAMEDLASGRGSLADVAHRRGFSDQSHLTRWLKRTTGWTPAVYRALGPMAGNDDTNGIT